MSEWISVKDRLPDEETFHVLLRIDRVDEQSTWDIGLYDHVDKRWIHRLSQRYTCTITHWMPLPDPPEVPYKKSEHNMFATDADGMEYDREIP